MFIRAESALPRLEFELVFVDDGSSDGSFSDMEKFARFGRNVLLIRHERNAGMGAAIKTGIRASHGSQIITMDADLTFRAEDIRILLDAFEKHPDVDCISGSPYLGPGLLDEVQPVRRLMSKGVNLLYRMMLGWEITSVSPIFRLYKKDVFDRITLQSNNFEINAEILSKMIFSGLLVLEVPVALHHRQYGKSKINVTKSAKVHVRLLYKIFTTKYLNKHWS